MASGLKVAARSGEAIVIVDLSNHETALITALAAPDVDVASLQPTSQAIDQEKFDAARANTGILPAALVGTEFVEGGRDSASQGTTKSATVDPSRMTLRSVSAATSTTFAIAWDSSAPTHAVYRDGVKIADLNTPRFSDAGLSPSSHYQYQIDSTGRDGMVTSKRLSVRTMDDGAQPAATSASALTAQTWTSAAVYRTFIPQDRVGLDLAATWACGQQFTSNRTFGGDSRSYVTPPYDTPWDSTSSRTSVFINVNWGNPAPYDIGWVKTVGTTHLYEGTTLIDQRTASDAGIKVEEAYSSTTYAQARVNHDVGNPFCAAGSIKYNVLFRWYRNSGTFEVVGWRQPAPAHELYGRWSNSSGTETWHEFGRFDNEGFNCLAGGCPIRSMNISRTY